jgi:hypothetical protein
MPVPAVRFQKVTVATTYAPQAIAGTMTLPVVLL